ncbi:hypothetical protein NN561_019657 [Cricetulus griseus]
MPGYGLLSKAWSRIANCVELSRVRGLLRPDGLLLLPCALVSHISGACGDSRTLRVAEDSGPCLTIPERLRRFLNHTRRVFGSRDCRATLIFPTLLRPSILPSNEGRLARSYFLHLPLPNQTTAPGGKSKQVLCSSGLIVLHPGLLSTRCVVALPTSPPAVSDCCQVWRLPRDLASSPQLPLTLPP